MSKLDDKINALLQKQGVKDEPDAVTAPRKKAAAKKKPAKKKSKKRPARAKKKVAKKKAPAKAKPTSEQPITGQGSKNGRVAGVDPQLFAHRYVQYHCNALAAYKDLRPDVKDSTASSNAYKALNDARVQRVLWPLLEALLEKEEAQSEFIIKRWLEQAEASPLDYFEITDTGRLGALKLDELTASQVRNLRSIQVSDTKYGQTIKVTVVDQQKATELLARSIGMLAPKADEETEHRIGNLLERGVQRIRKMRDLEAWKDVAVEAEFSEVG